MRQAVTHLFETVEEGIIWTQIVQKCAELGNTHCPKAFDKEACMTTPFYKNEHEKQLQHLNKLDMSWDEACEQGVIKWAEPEEYRTYLTYLNEDPDNPGKPKGFGTPSKKLEIYCESNIILGRTRRPVVAVRRGEAAYPAARFGRLRAAVLLCGAGGVALDRH